MGIARLCVLRVVAQRARHHRPKQIQEVLTHDPGIARSMGACEQIIAIG